MARMPGSEWLGEHGGSTITRHDIVCVHTIVGHAPAHAAHFSTHHDGRIQQSRDTKYRSAANLNGNYRIVAIENEDHGGSFPAWSGSNVPALTDAQVTANAEILAWAHRTHGVPLQLCPNSRPGSKGLAYHRQGIDGNFGGFDFPGRVSGGEVWTEHFGKVCPGDRRIAQLPEILRRAKAIVEGEDMPSAEEIADAVWARAPESGSDKGEKALFMLQQASRGMEARDVAQDNAAALERAHAKLDEALGILRQLPTAVP